MVTNKPNTATLLATFVQSVAAFALSVKALGASLKAVWGKIEEDVLKETFHVTYITSKFGVTKEKAVEAYGKAWLTKANAGGANVMTKAQFNWMNAAKQQWNRAKDEAGVSVKNPNKVAAKKNAEPEVADASKVVMPKGAPKVATSIDFAQFALAYATVAKDLYLNNRTHKAFCDDRASEIYNAVSDHVDCIKAIIAKYEEEA